MELQRMIARFVAEPAPFTQQALYLARRSILDTMGAMIAMVDGMGIKQDFICKIVVSAISLVLNYIFSKWFIFKKKES